ncbi:hypothetical protein Fmac_007880 [Flemingia macrophylla]|uniref:Uncharacterized protein n=1 Tax=Flemingia macrophylla TaxID=520843 RepID=A0ABD1MVT7_9FABA
MRLIGNKIINIIINKLSDKSTHLLMLKIPLFNRLGFRLIGNKNKKMQNFHNSKSFILPFHR